MTLHFNSYKTINCKCTQGNSDSYWNTLNFQMLQTAEHILQYDQALKCAVLKKLWVPSSKKLGFGAHRKKTTAIDHSGPSKWIVHAGRRHVCHQWQCCHEPVKWLWCAEWWITLLEYSGLKASCIQCQFKKTHLLCQLSWSILAMSNWTRNTRSRLKTYVQVAHAFCTYMRGSNSPF